MIHALWIRLDRQARHLSPFAAALVLVVLNALPLPIPEIGRIGPSLLLAAVFYWSIFRPELMPNVAVFALGLVHDVLSGGPLGIWAAVLLLARQVLVSQRRVFLGETFLVFWMGFLIVALVAEALVWIVFCALAGQLTSPLPAVGQFLMSVAFYPAVAWLCLAIQRAFLSQD